MKKIKIFTTSVFSAVSFLPLIALAANSSTPSNFKELIMNTFISGMIKPAIYLIVALSILVFIWGIFKFIRAEGGEDKESGKWFMLWGIIGLFVMFSVWGLVNIAKNTFNLNNTQLNIPTINM